MVTRIGNGSRSDTTHDDHYIPVSLSDTPLFCGDDRPADGPYVQLFGGVINLAYNQAIAEEALQPGSVSGSLKQRVETLTTSLVEQGMHPGVHSDAACEHGAKLRQSTEGPVGCAYAEKRPLISKAIAEFGTDLADEAARLRPELFQHAADRDFALAVIAAHGRLAERDDFQTAGRKLVLGAVAKGAAVAVLAGKHIASEGIINLTPHSTFDSAAASAAGLPAYNHDAWAAEAVFERLGVSDGATANQRQIANLIDALGTMHALGVEAIVVRGQKDTILTVNIVEPGLVRAVQLHSQRLGRPLKGLALVHEEYANIPDRPRDDSGLFTEIICDFNNPNDLQRVLKPYHDTILAATCRLEESVQPFSRLIPFLPYNHTPSESALFWSTEKPLMIDRLRNYDETLVPKYQYVEPADIPRIAKLIKDFEFPLIIKPTGLSKAMLVSRNETMAQLRKNLARTFDVIGDIYQKQQYPGKPGLLIEEMMEGDMYSVDAYVSHDGNIWCLPPVKVTTAHAIGLDGFYGYEQCLPSGLRETEVAGAVQASEAAIKALSLSATTTHIEMFRTKSGWKIIEIAARIGGLRDTLYREAYGIEHFLNDLLIHQGQEPDIPRTLLKHACAVNIFAESEGRIVSIDGFEAARKLASVAELDIKIPAGELAIYATEGGNAIIRGVLSHEDPKQLQKDLRRLRELIDIKVRPSQTLAIRRAGAPQTTKTAAVLK